SASSASPAWPTSSRDVLTGVPEPTSTARGRCSTRARELLEHARSAATDQRRHHHRDEERGTVADVANPALDAGERQTGDRESEEEDRHERSDHVETSGPNRRRTEEHGGERLEAVADRPDLWAGSPVARDEQHAGECGHGSRHDEREEHESVDGKPDEARRRW